MLSCEIELNQGLHWKDQSPLFFLINCQSLKNKFEEISSFLQAAPIETFFAVTETWFDTDCNIEDNFITASHTFLGNVDQTKQGLQGVED